MLRREGGRLFSSLDHIIRISTPRTSYICASCRAFTSHQALRAALRPRRAPIVRHGKKTKAKKDYMHQSPQSVGKYLLDYIDEDEQVRFDVQRQVAHRLPAWKIEWSRIEALMRWVFDNEQTSTKDFLSALKHLGVPLEAILPLSRAMIRANDLWPGLSYFGRELTHKASEAGNSDATCFLMSSALRFEQTTAPEIKSVIKEIERLSSYKQDVRATILLALLHKERGEIDEAIRLLKLAIDFPPVKTSEKEDVPEEVADLHLGRALRELGTIHLDEGDRAAAKEVWKRAAEEGGDPQAYAYLTSLAPRDTMEWYQYTLKAATGAHLRSIHQLGVLYASCVDQRRLAAIRDKEVRAEIEHIASKSTIESNALSMFNFRQARPADLATRKFNLLKYARMWLTTAAQVKHVPSLLTLARIDWDLDLRLDAGSTLGVAALEGADDLEKHSKDVVDDFLNLRELIREDEYADGVYEAFMKRFGKRPTTD